MKRATRTTPQRQGTPEQVMGSAPDACVHVNNVLANNISKVLLQKVKAKTPDPYQQSVLLMDLVHKGIVVAGSDKAMAQVLILAGIISGAAIGLSVLPRQRQTDSSFPGVN